MQNLISWEQLFIWLFILLFVYYAVVLTLFYRQDLLKLRSRFTKSAGPNYAHVEQSRVAVREDQEYEDLYNTVHELMKDCRGVFGNVTNAPVDRNQLIADLSRKVKLYPQIKGTAFQISLSNHFAQEASHRLGVELEDEELEKIWQ